MQAVELELQQRFRQNLENKLKFQKVQNINSQKDHQIARELTVEEPLNNPEKSARVDTFDQAFVSRSRFKNNRGSIDLSQINENLNGHQSNQSSDIKLTLPSILKSAVNINDFKVDKVMNIEE